ncbi:MAG TPA: Fic family protein [Bauldia sp.]|nr:Fic family protein [Bauldia sp.]
MIHAFPAIDSADREVVGLIHEQRKQLRFSINQNPVRWTGFLRRSTFARAMQGSNSIEGIDASFDEAVAIVDNEKPESVEDENYAALLGYRNAMTYVLQLHDDPYFVLQPQVIKSLHFIMISYDMTKAPGQWRNGEIFVVRERTGEQVYKGPDAGLVPSLMDELVAQAADAGDMDPMIKGAMAHLNLAMIHPFRDGNGRMARALQTLVIARDGILAPTFSSIEEWLGRNTDAYYAILAAVGGGAWHPGNDAGPWIRFCLRAHFQQAATLIKRNAEIGRVWDQVATIISANGLPERTEIAVMNAAFWISVRNSVYRTENAISDVVASRDLKKLCDIDLLVPVGEKRGRHYVATKALLEIRERSRDTRRAGDPYELIRQDSQPKLPGLL